MEPSGALNKGKKGVETEPPKESVHSLPLRCDGNQKRKVEGKPYDQSL